MSLTKYQGKDLLLKRQITATTWITLTAYAVGAFVTHTGNTYVCTAAGTSGATGPVGTTLNATESDGTVTWQYTGTDLFVTIAGMKSTKFVVNNEVVDVTTKSDMPWRQLMAAGVRSLSSDASGAFNSDTSLNLIMNDVMTNNFPTCKIISGRGDIFVGVMQIVSCERSGDYNKEEIYSFKIESAGTITYTPGT